jgi:hypothetical protein
MHVRLLFIFLLGCFPSCHQVPFCDIELFHSPYIDKVKHLEVIYNSKKIFESALNPSETDFGVEPVRVTCFDYEKNENQLRIICDEIDTTFLIAKNEELKLLCIHYHQGKLRLGDNIKGDFFPMD